MPDEKNHINYTATDIEKYHAGELSPRERHAMEKAALDDPFLADALEGFAVTGVNAGNDMADLKERLSHRIHGAKLVTMQSPKTKFSWLRAAAMVVFLAGSGFLVYQLAFNDKRKEVAILDDKKATAPGLPEPVTTVSDSLRKDNVSITTGIGADTGFSSSLKSTGDVSFQNVDALAAPDRNRDSLVSGNILSPVATSTEKINDFSESFALGEKGKQKKNAGFVKEESKSKDTLELRSKNDIAFDKSAQKNEQPYKFRAVSSNTRKAELQQNDNYFRGRVIDANNNPVPFANITNTRDNAGTYTDAKGYFNFVSPDTVLEVQVRSIGFENNNIQLRNAVPSNEVVMQDDRRNMAAVVISNKKPNTEARSRLANVKLEEPEPADGWENYDTYLANNLKPPEDLKIPETQGEVAVSFEVNKNGEPVNLKVEKSLCSTCDKEAIRLIKEGPKWKRKARKGRTTVTVAF